LIDPIVITGLVPVIHLTVRACGMVQMDARNKSGHDGM
jgi:hypothetical protein